MNKDIIITEDNCVDIIIEKNKEIERLNNIINELEKFIEQIRLEYCNELTNRHNCIDIFI